LQCNDGAAPGCGHGYKVSAPSADKFYREAGDMNTDRTTANVKIPATAAKIEFSRMAQSCYVASAPVGDVLFDQLEYLVAHSGRDCPPECLECGRLERVKHWLLLPFRKSSMM
jgi:hypothetical protein